MAEIKNVTVNDIVEELDKGSDPTRVSENYGNTMQGVNKAVFPRDFDDDLPINKALQADMINHPPHYTSHPKGIECVDVVEENPYPNLAEAMRYLWRVSWGSKGDKIQDLEKAIWYIQRHIKNLKSGRAK